jgi:SAM-dependent methyltransferase
MPDGRLPLPDRTFDLITCFGVLHHIPNVSFVTAELARTLKPGGYIALREPIISLGDWRRPRPGLTKRERGIPLHLLHKFLEDSGLVVCRWSLCGFTVLPRVFKLIRPDFYNSGLIAYVDALVSRTFSWNANYHPQSIFDRIRPTSAFFVARKPNNEV